MFISIIIIFNGFYSWSPTFDITHFLTAYLGVPIYFGLYIIWKVVKRTEVIPVEKMDIYTGKEALDAIVWPERKPRNVIERCWFWIA
jgi:yeast amino acid transporter